MNCVKILVAVGTSLAITSCQSIRSDLPSGQAAYDVIPATPRSGEDSEYRVGPLDVLAINVFREPDLSLKDVQVDATGRILLPLAGPVTAKDKTVAQLSSEIASKLNAYLVDPQVSVSVTSSVTQQITVEGNVTQPGSFDLVGSSTLLQALAQAKSPTRVARLDQVVVFRNVNGQRMGAVFDVRKIRVGASPDPQLIGGDIVVVGFSAVKGAFRDILTTAPLLNVFRAF